MKVYAVIERCEDYYYPDYTIVDNCVYQREEDAKKRLEGLNGSGAKENPCRTWPEQFEIHEFEVKE